MTSRSRRNSRVRFQLDFDFDFLAVNSKGIARDVLRCRWAEDAAAGYVEDGSVPRAGDFCPYHYSIRKRPAPMRTGVVNRIERSVNVENRYPLSAGLHRFALTGSDLAGFGNPDELRHRTPRFVLIIHWWRLGGGYGLAGACV